MGEFPFSCTNQQNSSSGNQCAQSTTTASLSSSSSISSNASNIYTDSLYNSNVLLLIEEPLALSSLSLSEKENDNDKINNNNNNNSNNLERIKTQRRSSGRLCAGQIIACSSTGELQVQLYQPVQPLLERAGAPPPATDGERLARLLAVATSSCYVRIPSKQVLQSCEVKECPIAVTAALALGKQPVLFKVGTCQQNGQISWSPQSSGYLSSSSSAPSSFSSSSKNNINSSSNILAA